MNPGQEWCHKKCGGRGILSIQTRYPKLEAPEQRDWALERAREWTACCPSICSRSAPGKTANQARLTEGTGEPMRQVVNTSEDVLAKNLSQLSSPAVLSGSWSRKLDERAPSWIVTGRVDQCTLGVILEIKDGRYIMPSRFQSPTAPTPGHLITYTIEAGVYEYRRVGSSWIRRFPGLESVIGLGHGVCGCPKQLQQIRLKRKEEEEEKGKIQGFLELFQSQLSRKFPTHQSY
ncbi:hypothetical protein B0H17DRAFT_1126871 [Mycena rosella]|uniref:Uncharacterized protein n=1 Tax=Mycena rosella TaxID=1033263 RepID=A0AAD7M7F9_MYCRO|nr:hypothetical protein B0H17DRAFT_1126871 [Mycena rosella]